MTHALRVADYADLSHDAWLTVRQGGIGGSDAAAAVGESQWQSPLTLWARKTGRLDGPEDNEAMEWGRRHEATVLQAFTEKHPGLTVRRLEAVLRHPEHEFMLANLDAVCMDGDGRRGIVECKTAGHYMGVKWKGEATPLEYVRQVEHYLEVLGPKYEFAFVPVLIGGNHYEERKIYRDEARLAELVEGEREFWRHVVEDERPPIDGHDSTTEALARLWSDSVKDFRRLPAEALELIHRRQDAIDDEKAARRRRAEAENALRAMLEESESGSIRGHAVRWKTSTTTRIDTKRLRAERPDIAAEFATTSSSRRFTVTED